MENVTYVADLTLRDDPEVDLYVIDEIGKMELFSARFTAAVKRILEGDRPLLATIPAQGRFVEAARARDDVTVVEVTREGRDALPGQILSWLSAPGDRAG